MKQRATNLLYCFIFLFLFVVGSQYSTSVQGASKSTALLFSDQTAVSQVAMTHATPITSGDGAKMISGAAAGDFNNDGWQDLYVIGGGLVADNLFINQGDGTFDDMAASAGLADLHLGSGTAVGDYNKDGWLDIYVTSFGPPDAMAPGQHLLFRNNGDLTFTDVAVAAGVNQASPVYADGLGAAFGDYDLDGDLDLFVTGWRKPGGTPALGNRLFRNNGNGTFDDVTNLAGIVDEGIRGFSPCFVDMDGDRYPELLLGADFGTSQYFINKTNGTFQEYTDQSGTGEEWSGMGTAVGDVNNDGRFDWYVSAIYDDDGVGRGDGSKLYLNQGNHSYMETAASAGVDDGGWAWGTVIVDLDHDGWSDILGTNGWDLPSYIDEMSKVWINNQDNTFTEMAATVGFNHTLHGMGVLNFDYDNDGDQDIVVTAYNDDLHLYRNDLPATNNWLQVKLDTSAAPDLAADGFGSRITVQVNGQTYYRYLNGCSHYLSQSAPIVHFGLSTAESIDELRVEWANDTVLVMTDVAINQLITLSATPQQRVFLPIVKK
ncbi:MAG: CRTAC1 family protein [Chloroflexi bacterium]|nr:CRTAC1 family protein [Chloroflexota bacterium]